MIEKQDLKDKYNVNALIGISGGSDGKAGKIQSMVSETIMRLKPYKVAIIAGATTGVPAYAVESAKFHKVPIIGVVPQKGADRVISGLDELIVCDPRTGTSQWGDESEVFVKLADGMALFAGGNGTAIEFYHAMKINQSALSKGSQPVYVAPMVGVGGFSERVYDTILPGYVEPSLPDKPLKTPEQAVDFLVKKLLLR
jgi:predicted Rossmann-fold nucleotide-binding protein